MAIEDFFDHKCDIYHLKKSTNSPGYGLPESASFSYPDTPDEPKVNCHFSVMFGTNITRNAVHQEQPINKYDIGIKLTLPMGTDVRINDKIVDCDSGFEYTAEQPRNIRNHHTFVYVKRTETQQPL